MILLTSLVTRDGILVNEFDIVTAFSTTWGTQLKFRGEGLVYVKETPAEIHQKIKDAEYDDDVC